MDGNGTREMHTLQGSFPGLVISVQLRPDRVCSSVFRGTTPSTPNLQGGEEEKSKLIIVFIDDKAGSRQQVDDHRSHVLGHDNEALVQLVRTRPEARR